MTLDGANVGRPVRRGDMRQVSSSYSASISRRKGYPVMGDDHMAGLGQHENQLARSPEPRHQAARIAEPGQVSRLDQREM